MIFDISPAHQLIMDVDDDIWVDAFTKEELDEIKSACNCQLFDELPNDVYDLTSKVVEKVSLFFFIDTA